MTKGEKVMSTLVMVRHGQSQANLDNVFTGWSDSPLTPLGIEQGHKVGQELRARGYLFHDNYVVDKNTMKIVHKMVTKKPIEFRNNSWLGK